MTDAVDHSLSARHRIYGRYSWDFWEEAKNNLFDNTATGIVLNRKNRVLGMDDAYTLRDNLLTNLRAGYTRQLFPERRQSQGFDIASWVLARARSAWSIPRRPTFPNVSYDGLQALGTWESGDGYFTTDVYNGHRQPDVAARQPQPEVRHGIPLLRRGREPLPTAVSPHNQFQQPVDPRADGQLRRRPPRAGLRVVHARVPTGGSMSRAAAYTEKNGVLSFYAHDDWRVRRT